MIIYCLVKCYQYIYPQVLDKGLLISHKTEKMHVDFELRAIEQIFAEVCTDKRPAEKYFSLNLAIKIENKCVYVNLSSSVTNIVRLFRK